VNLAPGIVPRNGGGNSFLYFRTNLRVARKCLTLTFDFAPPVYETAQAPFSRSQSTDSRGGSFSFCQEGVR
jgi:hypothetical protein